jgi:transposase-like protein
LSLKEIEMAKRERDAEKAQYWRLVLEEFAASGLNVREFCRREGLREPSFYAWRRELNQRDGAATSSAKPNAQRRDRHVKKANEPATAGLVEVVTRPIAGARAIEIETPTGFTIRLGQEVDRELVASVLARMIPLDRASC